MKDLRGLLQHELQDLYSAESQWIDTLPKMCEAVSSQRLRQTFDQQLSETRRQRERLEQIAELMHISATGEKCKGMEGLVRESEIVLRARTEPEIRDAALIGAAQKVEHYQIAGYGTARSYAQLIGEAEVADMLDKCLTEVKNTDHKLTNVAMDRVNKQALA